MSGAFQHESQFDIFEWYPRYQICLRFFLRHAQHNGPVQAVATIVNIKLPCQKSPDTLTSRPPLNENTGSADATASVALVPYVRRLVATGFDTPAVLHAFFGDDWPEGVGTIHETERRNFLFAAKSDTWLRVKANYDMEDGQSVPFLRPLQRVTEAEIVSAESNWSEWLAMQDWMLGPRAPPSMGDSRAARPRRD